MKKITPFLTIIIVSMQIASGIIMALAINGDESQQIQATNTWMLLNATQWVFAFTVIALLTSGLFSQLTWVVCLLWVGKLVDEIWFDPTVLSWNDILNFGIAENIGLVLVTIHLVKKNYAIKSRTP